MKIEHIIFSNCHSDDFAGKYNLKFTHSQIEWNNEKFIYHSSGGCRDVFISPCKTFVLKIPIGHCGDFFIDKQTANNFKGLEWSIKHNILEVMAYEQCPDDLKHWFAKSELIEHGWVKQEFVDVFDFNHSSELRELGRKSNNQVCLFDYDPIIDCDLYYSPFRSTTLEDIQFARKQFEDVVAIMKTVK